MFPSAHYSNPEAFNSDRANISFRVAKSVIIAALRFRSFSDASSLDYQSSHGVLGRQSSHEVRLHLDEIHAPEFNPELVKSFVDSAASGNSEKFKQLGGIQGHAKHLHTDFAGGLDIQHGALASRKRMFGENRYPRKARETFRELIWWRAFCDTTLNIPILLCAILSLGVSIKSNGIQKGWYDGFSITLVVVLGNVIATISNYGQSSSKLQHLLEEKHNIQVQAVRGGQQVTVPAVDIVVGDIVKLRKGDQVPADGLLVQGRSLTIDESSFTGETDYSIPDSDKRAFLLRAGSTVQNGHGFMLVTSVGINTE